MCRLFASNSRKAATPPPMVEPRTNSKPRWLATSLQDVGVAVPAQQHRQVAVPAQVERKQDVLVPEDVDLLPAIARIDRVDGRDRRRRPCSRAWSSSREPPAAVSRPPSLIAEAIESFLHRAWLPCRECVDSSRRPPVQGQSPEKTSTACRSCRRDCRRPTPVPGRRRADGPGSCDRCGPSRRRPRTPPMRRCRRPA